MTHIFESSSLPPTEALVAFRRTRDLGSYAAASRAEGVNHATILRRVATLEAWLGTRLFERAGRGVVLTPAGQRFSGVVDDVVEALEGAADHWKPKHAPVRIALSVLPAFARLRLAPILPALLRGEPGAPRWRVELSVSHTPVPLGEGRFDVAIRYGAAPWEGLSARPLTEESLLPVAHGDLLGVETPDAASVAKLPLIHDSDVGDWRRWFQSRGLAYRAKPDDLRLEDYDLALSAAQQGLGALLLRGGDAAPPPPLRAIADAPMANPRRHWIVTAGDEARPAVLAFADRLHECLEAAGS